VKNISGRVEASTGGGSIDLDKVAGNISGETGGGSINVGKSAPILIWKPGAAVFRFAPPRAPSNCRQVGAALLFVIAHKAPLSKPVAATFRLTTVRAE